MAQPLQLPRAMPRLGASVILVVLAAVAVGASAQQAAPQAAAAPNAPSKAESAVGTGVNPPDLDDVPSTAPIPPARTVSPEAQVEQKRDGARHVSEVIVVPAGTNLHYSLINREGQRPTSPLSVTPGGLSTQRFIRLDF